MKNYIQEKLASIVNDFTEQGLLPAEAKVRIMVENTKDKSHGDFATNLAMLLSKPMQKKPAEIAALIAAKIPTDNRIAKVEIAGPGFINFYANSDFLAEAINAISTDPKFGVKSAVPPVTTVVDYSSPNVAKEMAVHHIRSTVIGDAVVRVLEFLGNKVIRANHIGRSNPLHYIIC